MPQIASYIKHLAKAKNRHGVHSPFVYTLLDNVIYAQNKNVDPEIEQLRQDLLLSKALVEVTDHGVGSRVMKSSQRKISEIAHYSASNPKLSTLLMRLAIQLEAENILELGTNLGLTSLYLSNVPKAQIHSIEGCSNLIALAQGNFKKLRRNNIISYQGTFKETLSSVLSKMQKVDLAYIDGNHQEKATISYFKEIFHYCHNDSVIIIGDIHWSSEMENAWKLIKDIPEVKVTLDLYSAGLIFFRKEQVKQHFLIRF